MIINEAMQKRHGCHLQVTVVNVNTPSGEDGAAIEIEWFHGHPASFLDTSSEISHPIHLIHLEARLSICLHKLPHRDTDICAIPSNSTRGKTTPPKFASRKILVNDASVCQAKAALNGQSSRVFTSSQIPHCGSRGYSPVQPEVPGSINMPIALHRWLRHRDFPTLWRGDYHEGNSVRDRRIIWVPDFSNLSGRMARYG